MKGKYKLTRFARFVIFLALISPACYLGGLHFQNDLDILDFTENLSFEWSIGDSSTEEDSSIDKAEDLKEEIEELKDEILELESELNEKELELKELNIDSKEV